MRYFALACDYDGTLAQDGWVPDDVVRSLTRLRDTGRRLILVTGRELEDLRTVFPQLELFDRVVAENGGVLYCPATRAERALAEPPPEDFVAVLREHGVTPLSVGHTIVATWQPHETVVLETIEQFGLEHQVIFNKGAVMVLPPGVNKATGLDVALSELGLSPHNVVAVGDAENDQAFLHRCECGVAVANALPTVTERADIVTAHDHGAGVIELIEQIIADDLRSFDPQLHRPMIVLGTRDDESEVRIEPLGRSILIAGTSGAGKSTIATAILERLAQRRYQFCLVDPEGDYSAFADAVVLGDTQQPPTEDEVIGLLSRPNEQAIVSMLGVPMEDRPTYFASLLSRLQELRTHVGRPHWIALDEAHHLLRTDWQMTEIVLPDDPSSMLLLTVHPEHVSPTILSRIDLIITLGEKPHETLAAFCTAVKEEAPRVSVDELEAGQAHVWDRRKGGEPFVIRMALPIAERRRHTRKYATGDLAPIKSFYFRGPEGKLNLRAQNLAMFRQLAEGVDDATWLYHLQRGYYSRWFKEMIGDEELAMEAARAEQQQDLSPAESRAAIAAAIEHRYTLPA
jgi:hydroxymethylpyrimidine pyrophosphatase-like HAD family hydrolase